MHTVSLEGMLFSGYHGFHPEEEICGNTFEVTVHLEFEPGEEILGLNQSVDYEAVYGIVKSVMGKRQLLLEQLVQQISCGLKDRFPLLRSSDVRVRKLHPPLEGEVASCSVRQQNKY
ncbi:MAG TPA: dihydroneopterin aldolase [Chitinophagaceae bacterium]|nr:dihydroneopterin aldolase [Chitinophagaceae bacterium]